MLDAKNSNANAPTLIRVKAVPGASRDSIAGILGDRLKVRISAAPEGGKANKAICTLIARSLDIKPAMVEIISGHTNPEKTVLVDGCTVPLISEKLGIDAKAAVVRSK
jgi:uncharacterized protein (TIGR00251 family)